MLVALYSTVGYSQKLFSESTMKMLEEQRKADAETLNWIDRKLKATAYFYKDQTQVQVDPLQNGDEINKNETLIKSLLKNGWKACVDCPQTFVYCEVKRNSSLNVVDGMFSLYVNSYCRISERQLQGMTLSVSFTQPLGKYQTKEELRKLEKEEFDVVPGITRVANSLVTGARAMQMKVE